MMFGQREINLQLSERANIWLTDNFKNAVSEFKNPILCLEWGSQGRIVGGKEVETVPGMWMLSFKERDIALKYEGWLGITKTFEFHTMQDWIFDLINNRILDIDNNGFTFFEPSIPFEMVINTLAASKRPRIS